MAKKKKAPARVSKVLQELRENPLFRSKQEKSGKGKGSYTRKEKHPRQEGVSVFGLLFFV